MNRDISFAIAVAFAVGMFFGILLATLVLSYATVTPVGGAWV